jgi:hypothetical protein
MMKTKLLFQKMGMVFAILFSSVISVNAATITYSLKTQATIERSDLSWQAFLSSPISFAPPALWHVTYKIQKADGSWYDDFVFQKTPYNLTPSWPVSGFNPVDGYEYDFFYRDPYFTDKFEGAMPDDENTVLFIREIAPAPEIYWVTYKIFQADGTWYEDIVKEKDPNNLTPEFPSEYTMKEGYEYDYFYTDASFSEKFEGAMPNNSNTTLYIKEKTIEYLTNAPWKTLVIPFSIDNLPDYFGADYEGVPAVDVLEFQEIQNGAITKVGEEDFYSCKLVFNPVRKIEAYKPYFFRVNRVDEMIINDIYAAEGNEPCGVTTVIDEAYPGISISMEGTLEPNGVYMDASDGLHFYFGYNDRNETYNFYRVSTMIPKNRCWFYVNDNRGYDTKKLNVTFDMDGVTGIGQVMTNTNTANDKVYNLNGQQVAGKLQKGIYIVNGKKVLVK